MKNSITAICQKYQFPINEINLDMELSDIVDDIERKLINRESYSVDPRRLMAELWKLQNQIESEKFRSTDEFKNIIEEIFLDSDFCDGGDFIQCNCYIPCMIVHTPAGSYILNDDQISKFTKMGYGISNFKIRKSETIREVYCEGKHPNLNELTKQFCLDIDILESELNIENLSLVKEMLSQINMKNAYCPSSEIDKIMEVL